MEVLVDTQKLPAIGDADSADDLLESLDYVEGLLNGMVQNEAMVQVVFRLPGELMDRLDAHVRRLKSADPSKRVSRSAVVGQLLASALERNEA